MDNDKNKQLLPMQEQNLSTQLIKAKFQSLPEETQTALAELAAKNHLEMDKKIKEAQLQHYNAERDIDKFISATHDLNNGYGGKQYSSASTNITTTTGNIHMESKSSRCYVATATYDNAYHPNVIILRDYRDRYLRKSTLGKLFIYTYYSIGPYLAYLPQHINCVKVFSKNMLDHLVLHIAKKYYL